METIDVDVLVCGGGMSGMACAAFAADSGAKVLVVEKQSEIGGSSNYSAGMFWAPQTYHKLRDWVPQGDPELQKAWLSDYLPAVQWMRENGVPMADRFNGIMTIGIGFPVNIPHLHSLHRKRIQSSKTRSEIFTNTSVVKLNQQQPGVSGSPITGAVIRRNLPNSSIECYNVRAKMVVLATGGFQGSSDLRSKYLGQGGDDIFLRSNHGSVGDGLKLALGAGAGTSKGMSSYYGHLLAAPLRAEEVDPKDYLPLAQYQSKHCLLLNENGQRFADESTGDEIINQYLAKQEKRRGFLLFNEKTRVQHCITALFPNAGDIDRMQKAREHGCNVESSPTLTGLGDILHKWGVDRSRARRTIDEITFTYGGIAIDNKGHALTADGSRIPGLLVAGVDAGGFSNLGYAGGLALAFVTGLWAAQEVAHHLGLPGPHLPAADARDGEDRPPRGRL
ncbi:unnamed protein product [Penicillium bialowiezense]